MLTNLSDGALIALFVNEKREDAFDALLRRHYKSCYQRFYSKVNDDQLANDLCQKLWMRVLANLGDYRDSNKFEHYLNTIISNLLKDEWRSRSNKPEVSIEDEKVEFLVDQKNTIYSTNDSLDDQMNYKHAVDEMINNLIPSLPCDQRLVFLLRHESEYWDDKQPLQWQHVAELNNIDISSAYQLFEAGRDKLVINTTHQQETQGLSCEEQIVFLLWTQAQRPDKSKKYTEQYFANLLNMPVNTFKTKYRASIKTLSSGLENWK